jgi:hypothetical protein
MMRKVLTIPDMVRLIVNMVGMVEDASYYGGATVSRARIGAQSITGGITVGSFILGNNRIEADPSNPLFAHEYGHYLQSQRNGWAYLGKYALPSLMSALRNTPAQHDFFLALAGVLTCKPCSLVVIKL